MFDDVEGAACEAHRPRRLVVGGQRADRPSADLPGEPGAATRITEPAREEQIQWCLQVPRVLEKERPLLGEEQVEAIEIDLLLVDFDLREVGVDGDVEVEPGRDAITGVEADVPRPARGGSGATCRWSPTSTTGRPASAWVSRQFALTVCATFAGEFA